VQIRPEEERLKRWMEGLKELKKIAEFGKVILNQNKG
jgi:hypothetical protein